MFLKLTVGIWVVLFLFMIQGRLVEGRITFWFISAFWNRQVNEDFGWWVLTSMIMVVLFGPSFLCIALWDFVLEPLLRRLKPISKVVALD